MKKILLVEDTSHLAEEIVDALRMEDFEVTLAVNGAEALNLLNNYTPDVIISDLLMPIMDGFQFIEQLRSVDAYKSIPVIILSARTFPEDKRRAKTLGANDFVSKPCKTNELITAIEKLLN